LRLAAFFVESPVPPSSEASISSPSAVWSRQRDLEHCCLYHFPLFIDPLDVQQQRIPGGSGSSSSSNVSILLRILMQSSLALENTQFGVPV